MAKSYQIRRTRCLYAHKYKGDRKPTCGCLECFKKYNNKQMEKEGK